MQVLKKSKVVGLIVLLMLATVFLVQGPAWAASIKVKDFYEKTGVGLVCGNPKVCSATSGKPIEGFVLDPKKLMELGFTIEFKPGATLSLVYQGGNFWTIEDPASGESIKVSIE